MVPAEPLRTNSRMKWGLPRIARTAPEARDRSGKNSSQAWPKAMEMV